MEKLCKTRAFRMIKRGNTLFASFIRKSQLYMTLDTVDSMWATTLY